MSNQPTVRKAVFPVAGLGTRFLPATKSIPKEMLPIVDKPLIQYAVEEALEAGVESLIFVTSRKKHSIADHFDRAYELETKLAAQGKDELLACVQDIIPSHVSTAYVPQGETLGLGHAVLCARRLVGDEPFAVMLADDLILSDGQGCLAQMVDVHQQTGASVLGVQAVAAEMTNRYGIVETNGGLAGHTRVKSIVEKPAPEEAPSNLGVVGRYVLHHDVFRHLEDLPPGIGGEIQLTDGIAQLLEERDVAAYAFDGVRYDCGSHLGFVKATVDYAVRHDGLRDELLEHLRSLSDLNPNT